MTLPPKLQETIEAKIDKAIQYERASNVATCRDCMRYGAESLYSILEPVLREVEEALEYVKTHVGDNSILARDALTRLRETIGPIQKQGE